MLFKVEKMFLVNFFKVLSDKKISSIKVCTIFKCSILPFSHIVEKGNNDPFELLMFCEECIMTIG